ncbi:MAG: hypothetical protein GY711_07885 [bacterium]|nr:hypothetical protein [bacterium]
MQAEHFHYSESDGVATIRLERPERLNALTFDSCTELRDTFAALRTRDEVRSVLMTGDFVSAERAAEIGLYDRVVPDDELGAHAEALARKLAAGPSMGLAVTKCMLNAEASMTLPEAMQAEGWIQAECMKHPDYRESYDAFVEKRGPDFVRNWPGWGEGEG